MARKPRINLPGGLYHVLARGNQRRLIFRDPRDYRAYLDRLSRYQERYSFTLLAYALMPNHVHLLIEAGAVPLSRIMQGLQQSYTQYFNKAHRTVGHCFQGRFKAFLCDRDAYLLALVRYLHLNPVRAGMSETPEAYPWSSHRHYLGQAMAPWVATEVVLPRFARSPKPAVRAYREFVRAGLGEGHRDDLYAAVDQRILGDDDFVEDAERRSGRRIERPGARPSVDMLMRVVSAATGIAPHTMRSPGRARGPAAARVLLAYLARVTGAASLRAIAAHVDRSPVTLSVLLRRFEERLASDPNRQRQVQALVESCLAAARSI